MTRSLRVPRSARGPAEILTRRTKDTDRGGDAGNDSHERDGDNDESNGKEYVKVSAKSTITLYHRLYIFFNVLCLARNDSRPYRTRDGVFVSNSSYFDHTRL